MSRRLFLLNGLAILAVVINHATQDGFIALFWWTDRYRAVSVPNYDQMGSLSYYGLVAAAKLALFSVPAFLFVTGFFVAYAARGSHSTLNWQMVKRRVLNLLLPYTLGCLAFFASEALLGVLYMPGQYLAKFAGISDAPLFYIPLLIQIYVLSPFLVPIAKRRPRLLLAGTALLHLGLMSVNYLRFWGRLTEGPTASMYLGLPSSAVVQWLLFYVLGLIFGLHLSQLKPWLVRAKWVLLGAVVLLAVVSVWEAEWVFQTSDLVWRSTVLTLPTTLYAITLVLCFLAFDRVTIPFSAVLDRLGGASLGIYLFHKPILLYAPKIIYHLAPWMLAYQAIYQPVLVALAIGIPLSVMTLVATSPVRRSYRYLFG